MRIEKDILIAECTAYDFKGELERRKVRDWLKSVSAFADTDGGTLFFGVANDATVVGVADPQSDLEFISGKISMKILPRETTQRPQVLPRETTQRPQILPRGRESHLKRKSARLPNPS